MNKRKLGLIFSALLISYVTQAEEALPTIEKLSTTSRVQFERLEIKKVNDHYILAGKVKRILYNSHVSPGYIDYSIYNGAGELISEGATTYRPSLSLRRWKYGSSFSVVLPETVDKESVVKVAFNRN